MSWSGQNEKISLSPAQRTMLYIMGIFEFLEKVLHTSGGGRGTDIYTQNTIEVI